MGKYRNPSLTTDIFIFDDDLNFILIKRKNEPYKDYWALPGGFVDYGECVEDAAIREALEETSINVELKELVGVYSDPSRDPRGHTVSITYTARGNMKKMNAADDACDIGLFKQEDLEKINLAFDHAKIIKDCLKSIIM
ncbi:NUDIX hydrolase [Methanobrevibacter millerae]|uniref:NUDIX domain-containing protein n=1 Tax=Methanobrevibacter millerae TaxID=230361 RepID=A0A0U2TW95_9EURY|nr:NUDIX hydrolase [Methanobrevibacter millerae]ALT69987.1 NUDIX domain-containing protein [Methanobrevibacter millerae]MBO6110049.1 NUDIX hydrolase [Methanobrevibacter sp.]MBP3226523.1 NUDIX hydrolase [Methanobrevibacter sp.]